MTSPWLAGLGKALTGLGGDLEQRHALSEQKKLMDEQRKRQMASDALQRLVTLSQIGGTELPTGVDPTQAATSAGDFNAMRSGGAIPNEALGIDDAETPSFYGQPRSVQLPGANGTMTNVLLDPSKTPQAMQERRAATQQASQDRRQQAQFAATTARDKATQEAKTLSGVKAARADYNSLKSMNAKHPLVQVPFDPENAANYGNALKFEEQKSLQASAYHPPVSEGDWAPSGAVDKVTGEPILFNKKSGARMTMAGAAPKPGTGGGGGGGQGQNMQARLIGAVSEGRLADERMTKFEESHLKGGKLNVSAFDQIGGNLATNLASSHSPTDIAIQGLAEGHMNDGGKSDYMQYQRDARLTARAEQLMSARGGSEAMANDNAFLARGGAHAPEATVRAAQKSRRALFGKLGAVMQTLTPDQAAKLAAGLEALAKDDASFDYAGTGASLFGGAGAPAIVTPKAGPAQSYEDWKKSKGVP